MHLLLRGFGAAPEGVADELPLGRVAQVDGIAVTRRHASGLCGGPGRDARDQLQGGAHLRPGKDGGGLDTAGMGTGPLEGVGALGLDPGRMELVLAEGGQPMSIGTQAQATGSGGGLAPAFHELLEGAPGFEGCGLVAKEGGEHGIEHEGRAG